MNNIIWSAGTLQSYFDRSTLSSTHTQIFYLFVHRLLCERSTVVIGMYVGFLSTTCEKHWVFEPPNHSNTKSKCRWMSMDFNSQLFDENRFSLAMLSTSNEIFIYAVVFFTSITYNNNSKRYVITNNILNNINFIANNCIFYNKI